MAVFIRTFIACMVIFIALNGQVLNAAPGAHGPDGEHLTTDSPQQLSLQPRFEAFSEVFELVGELHQHQLVLYLHDYQSNRPVADAQIELETANLRSSAHFVADKNHYLIEDPALLDVFQQHSRHELILTIISKDNADLLTASFDLSDATPHDHGPHDHHHGHFPWWSLPLGLLLFVAGVLVGRRGAAK